MRISECRWRSDGSEPVSGVGASAEAPPGWARTEWRCTQCGRRFGAAGFPLNLQCPHCGAAVDTTEARDAVARILGEDDECGFRSAECGMNSVTTELDDHVTTEPRTE